MKIAVAQTRPSGEDFDRNLKSHIRLVETAVQHQTDLIVFPKQITRA